MQSILGMKDAKNLYNSSLWGMAYAEPRGTEEGLIHVPCFQRVFQEKTCLWDMCG